MSTPKSTNQTGDDVAASTSTTASALRPRRHARAICQSEGLEASNDESEPFQRRSIKKEKEEEGTREEGTVWNNPHFKERYDTCTKLYNTNKITRTNVWELQIIDVLEYLTRRSGTNLFQVAGTSLDIATKIYGLQVDDIYIKGMQLARQLSRREAVRPTKTEEGTDTAQENADPSGDSAKAKKGTTKTRRTRKVNRTTLANLEDITAPIPKLEPVLFTPPTYSDVGPTGNLFTNIIPMNASHTKFDLFSNEKRLLTPDAIDKVIKPIQFKENLSDPKKYKLGLKNLKPAKLCPALRNFELDVWDPENDKPLFYKVTYDEDGAAPVYELDQSIPNLVVHDDAGEGGISDPAQEMQLHGRIETIQDFVPISDTAGMPDNKYSYNPILQTPSGKYIDQIWAGPNHWRFKYTRPAAAQSSSVVRPQVKRRGRKKKVIPPVDYKAALEAADSEEEEELPVLVLKKKREKYNAKRYTLPLPEISLEKSLSKELISRPKTYPPPKPPQSASASTLDTENADVPEYGYENPQDSNYCPQTVDDGIDDLGAGHLPMEFIGHSLGEPPPMVYNLPEYVYENPPVSNYCSQPVSDGTGALGGGDWPTPFTGANLVKPPPMVKPFRIPFAPRPKNINMNKLKSACWQELAKGEDEMKEESSFSKMYRGLQSNLPDKMKAELSPQLALVALLHDATDHNLKLEQTDNTDFQIKPGDNS